MFCAVGFRIFSGGWGVARARWPRAICSIRIAETPRDSGDATMHKRFNGIGGGGGGG